MFSARYVLNAEILLADFIDQKIHFTKCDETFWKMNEAIVMVLQITRNYINYLPKFYVHLMFGI